jgi:hypothetical protein
MKSRRMEIGDSWLVGGEKKCILSFGGETRRKEISLKT